MTADFPVFLDACVLANAAVCDIYLRLAEPPRLFVPKWSSQILDKVYRTHSEKLGWPEPLSKSFQAAVRASFPDAISDGYEHLLPSVANDEKNQHVLTAAIHGKASLILTFNFRDFPAPSLAPWGIEAVHPQDYLLTLYAMRPGAVIAKLCDIASEGDEQIQDVLLRLGVSLPQFAATVYEDMGGA